MSKSVSDCSRSSKNSFITEGFALCYDDLCYFGAFKYLRNPLKVRWSERLMKLPNESEGNSIKSMKQSVCLFNGKVEHWKTSSTIAIRRYSIEGGV